MSFTGGGVCTLDANQAGNATYAAATQAQQSFAVAPTPQSILFTSAIPRLIEVGGNSYTPTATATSGLTVALTVDSSSSSVCTISSGIVSFIGSGVCTLDANQLGSTVYAVAPQVQQAFVVAGIGQFISFTSSAPSPIQIGGTYNVTATSTSGLAVTISVDPSSSSVCSLTSGTVTMMGDGICVLDGNQSGNGTYPPASQVTQAFNVSTPPPVPSVSQNISIISTPLPSNQIGGAYNVTALSSSSLGVVITVDPSSSSVCSISGTIVTFIGDGLCTIDANQPGSAIYLPAAQVTQSINVSGTPQSIVFTSSAPSGPMVGSTYVPIATATSSLGVVITVDPSSSSVCSLSAGTVTFIGSGTCLLDANQAGNSTIAAATQVTQSIIVSGTSQKIVFTSTSPKNPKVGSAYKPAATGGGSNNPVTFSIATKSASGCSYDPSAGVVDFKSPTGTCVINANQAGTNSYEAAPEVFQAIDMGTSSPLSLTIYFANNSWVLNASSKSQLHTLALGIKTNGLTHLTITGYASSTGGRTTNDVLGVRRASAAATFLKSLLTELGVKKTGITVSGKGASNFVAYPYSDASNRRADIRAS